MLKRNLLILTLSLLALSLLAPTAALAEENKIDQRCFTAAQCKAAKNSGGGFHQSRETQKACGGKKSAGGEELGFCLPVGKANTVVKIGGQSSFANVGDYVQVIYRYGISIVGLLATIMIIIAGLQWASSGGNATVIQSAKKRIGGAIIGLLLAIFSYTILNTINPYLVNFRLPQTWMINTVSLSPEYCSEIKGGSMDLKQGGKYEVKPEATACGKDYYSRDKNGNEGASQCKGLFCKGKNVCVRQEKQSSCQPGMLAGVVTARQSLLNKDLEGNIIDNDLKLIAICKNGNLEEIDQENLDSDGDGDKNDIEKDYDQIYKFAYTNKINTVCSGDDGLVGFFLGAEINDESTNIFGGFFPTPDGSIISLGEDDWHAISKDAQNSHRCSTNLSIVAYEEIKGTKPDCSDKKVGVQNCSCGTISDEAVLKKLINKKSFTDLLITKEDLEKGFVCNIHITREEFPTLNNHTFVNWDETSCSFWQGLNVNIMTSPVLLE